MEDQEYLFSEHLPIAGDRIMLEDDTPAVWLGCGPFPGVVYLCNNEWIFVPIDSSFFEKWPSFKMNWSPVFFFHVIDESIDKFPIKR